MPARLTEILQPLRRWVGEQCVTGRQHAPPLFQPWRRTTSTTSRQPAGESVRAAGKFQMDLRAHQGGARAERVSGARGDERRFAKGVGAWLRCMRKRRRATRVSPEELNQYRECPYHALGLE